MNKFIGIGRLVRDPDVRISGDSKYARYTLAVDRRVRRDSDNADQQTADFIPCVCYGKNADFADSYLRKGMKIAVIGHIQTGKYTNKDGQTIYTTDIAVETQEFCESKGSSAGAQDSHSQQPKTANASQKQPAQDDTGFVNIPDGINIPDSFDGEVPFE